MTDQEMAQWAQDLYNQLKPEAVQQAVRHVLNRTPHELQDAMRTVIEADLVDAVIPEGWTTVRPNQPIWISCRAGWNPGMGRAQIVDGELASALVDADQLGFVYGGNPYLIYESYDGTTGPKHVRSPATPCFASNGYLNGFLLSPEPPPP